jgi:hypothetical protein
LRPLVSVDSWDTLRTPHAYGTHGPIFSFGSVKASGALLSL